MIGVVATPPSAPSEVIGDRRARKLLPRRRPGPRRLGEPAQFRRAVPEVARLGMAHHRRHETGRGLRGDAQMHAAVAMQDARLVVVERVDLRLLGDRLDHRAHEEGQHRELGLVGTARLVERGAQILERRDVDFLDISDGGDPRMGQRHLLGDPAPQPHEPDVFDRLATAQRRGAGGGPAAREKGVEVLVGDAPRGTAADDLAQIDAGLAGAQPDRGRGERPLSLAARRARRRLRGRRRARGGGRGHQRGRRRRICRRRRRRGNDPRRRKRFGARRLRRGPGLAGDLQANDLRSDRDDVADLGAEPENFAVGGRGNLDRRLVGHHRREDRVLAHEIADLDPPFHEFGLGDALARRRAA